MKMKLHVIVGRQGQLGEEWILDTDCHYVPMIGQSCWIIDDFKDDGLFDCDVTQVTMSIPRQLVHVFLGEHFMVSQKDVDGIVTRLTQLGWRIGGMED